jgi:hypothetical protein
MGYGHASGGNRGATVYGGNRYAGIVDYAVDDLFGHIRINGNRVSRKLSKFPRELIRARKL